MAEKAGRYGVAIIVEQAPRERVRRSCSEACVLCLPRRVQGGTEIPVRGSGVAAIGRHAGDRQREHGGHAEQSPPERCGVRTGQDGGHFG